MGLRNKNNPLGQRVPSDKVGGPMPGLEHGQSAELVENIRRKAENIHQDAKVEGQKKAQAPSQKYDLKGPDRQPGRIMDQKRLGKEPRESQEGQYTQDNEEEGSRV